MISLDKEAPQGNHSQRSDWGAGYGLLVILAGLCSPWLQFAPGAAPLFWLPLGVVLGALLREGVRTLPGLCLGLPLAYLFAGEALSWALALGLLDVCALVLLTALMRRLDFDPYLRQRRDGWLLLGVGVLLGSLLIIAGQHLLFPSLPQRFPAPGYSVSLGLLTGALPILAYSNQKLRQQDWRQVLSDWSVAWTLPMGFLCWMLLSLNNTPQMPAALLPVLGLLWMIWFTLDRGLGSAVTALLLSALLLGWMLATRSQLSSLQLEGSWGLLLAMGVLVSTVSPLLAELRIRDRRVRLALEGTQTAIWDWHLKSGSLLFSQGWLPHLGYPESPAGLSAEGWEKMIHPEDLPAYRSSLQEHLEGRSTLFRNEFRIRGLEEEPRWLIARGRITERDIRGRPLRLLGTLVDISTQKATKRYLQLLERALHAARDAVAIIDLQEPEQAVLFANPALEQLTGYEQAQVRGKPLSFLSPGRRNSAGVLLAQALANGDPTHGQHWVERRDGSGFWSHLSISPVRDERGSISHCIAIFSDVSAEVRAQEHLKERDELLQKLSQQVPGLIFQYLLPIRGEPSFPYTSDGLRQLFGLEPEQLRHDASAFFEALHPHDRLRMETGLSGQRAALHPWRDEFRVRLDGREYWREGHAIPELQANGDILWHGYIKDISEQVRLVMALGESEARFRAIANATPMLIWLADAAGHCVWFNQAWFDFTGLRFHLAPGSSWMEQVHPEERWEVQRLVEQQMALRLPFRLECRVRHRDTQWRWVINQGVPRQNERGEFMGYIGACMDIDEQKRVELALRQSREELRQMGLREEEVLEQERKRIASQVHDELGQLLTALKMGISALRLRFKHVAGLSEQVHSLNELSTRAFRVVRQVTTHLRPQALNHGLRPALEWLAQETTQSTGLQVRADCPEMNCQPGEAASTALFRMAQEGITNVLKHARAHQAEISLSCRRACLILIVRDDGVGFQADAPNAPTGYGLLGMRERAQNLGGEFRIVSNPGQGTTLFLSIPVEPSHECDTCHCCR